ncbi:hypothetical protein BH11BAC3_BH11BAC3_24690 [soil metagenome]
MNRKFFAMVIATILLSLTGFAQVADLYVDSKPWAANPVLHTMPANFKNESSVFLMDNRVFEYKFVGKDLMQFNYVYRLIKVTDDKGIEMFNKIYLPMSRNAEISDIKARVITSSGKVINVPEGKIKEEEEDGRKYKLFAMEGIDKGAEVEYSYIVKKAPSFFGSEIFQSKSVPYYQAKLLIITPKHLKFDAKGFNGFIVLKDSAIGDLRMTPGYSENILALDDEKYGLRDPYLQRADFKLSYNLASNDDVEMYTWNELVRKAYANISTLSEKEKKAVNKFVAAANVPFDAPEEKTIMILEDYMKTKINIDEKLVSEDADNLEVAIKNGNTNNFGAVRLFVAMLENKSVRYQVVFPSIRDQVPLDEELANWNRIDETLIYFTGTRKLVQPIANAYRYPYVEAYWAGTRGLFLKGTNIGGIRTVLGRFDDIPIEPFEQNAHNMEEFIKLDATGDSLIIESKQILKGYGALYYRPIWKYLPKDKQEETMKEIIQGVAKSENITNISAENTNLTDSWDNKPLIINGTIHTAELLERAGNKLLFKIGELIGNQVQMYQEKPRQLPAEIQYAHALERKIVFEIPAGYTIKNPDDIIIDVQHKKDNIVNMGFVSSYKIENNMLNVYILEVYHDLKYPLSDFEIYKKVINAAADFNKIVLVLDKKT